MSGTLRPGAAVALPIAHIVGGGAVWPLWLTGSLLFGGAVAAMAVPSRRRRLCLMVSGAGLVATVAVYIALPSSPPAPRGVRLTIAAPAPGSTVGDPVVVRVCGGGAVLPGAGRLLSISIDGRQVAEVRADTAAVNVGSGRHTLRVELVTAGHREYTPPVAADETVSVVGYAAPSQPPACPG